jgi:hypothetical protein
MPQPLLVTTRDRETEEKMAVIVVVLADVQDRISSSMR